MTNPTPSPPATAATAAATAAAEHAKIVVEFQNKLSLMAGEKYFVTAHAERVQALQFSKEYGQETVKTLIALNGGSIVALLTFIGAFLTKGDAPQMRMAAAMLHTLSPAFIAFAVGLLLATFVSALGYANFMAHVVIARSADDLYRMMILPAEKRREPPKWLGPFTDLSTWIAMACGFASGIAFLTGAWFVFEGFTILEASAWVEGAKDLPRAVGP